MASYPDPAPYGASGAYGGGLAPRQRERPSWRWFVVGAALLLTGVGLVVPAIVLSIAAFTQVQARVAADGVTQTISVEPQTVYLLWERPGQREDCVVVDAATRADVALRGLGSTTYTRDLGDGTWIGARTFTAASSSVEITCSPASSSVEVGERPRVHTVVGGVLLGLVVPILLGLAGAALLIVVGILHAVRRAPTRRR